MKRCAKCGTAMSAEEYDFDYCAACRRQLPYVEMARRSVAHMKGEGKSYD